MFQAATGVSLLAQADGDMIGLAMLLRHLLAAVVFSLMGVAVLILCIWMFDKLSPYSFRREILEDQNTALGLIVGALLLGVAIIIAAAIHG